MSTLPRMGWHKTPQGWMTADKQFRLSYRWRNYYKEWTLYRRIPAQPPAQKFWEPVAKGSFNATRARAKAILMKERNER